MKLSKLFFLALLLFIVSNTSLFASHLIVGEMTYKNVSPNNYEITLIYYRDCLPQSGGGGNPAALQSDITPYISVYNGTQFYRMDSIYSSQTTEMLPITNVLPCVTNSQICVNKMTVKMNFNLPPSTLGYTIINQRCCLNAGISNINDAGENGYSFYCKIPPSTIVASNNSAVFKPVTSFNLCVNKKYSIDHSATDADGDSLSYELAPLELGGGGNDPKPIITSPTIPTINTASYIAPYTYLNPMSYISLNATTGLLTIAPTTQGHFVVAIVCNEWRNGVKINSIKRAYTYPVENCSFQTIASVACDSKTFSQSVGEVCYSNCVDKTIAFTNQSTGAIAYHWDFGDNTTTNDTSSLANPSYTYPAIGKYIVRLLAVGSSCTDTLFFNVSVGSNTLVADFTTSTPICTGVSLQLNDASTFSTSPITSWQWNLLNPNLQWTNTLQNPSYVPSTGGNYTLNLTVFDSAYCYASIEKELNFETVDVKAITDTLMPVGSSFQLYATGANQYHWDYNGINSIVTGTENSQYPTVNFTNYGVTNYMVTGTQPNGCAGYDTIKVTISTNAYLLVPNAFSPNHDNLNDILYVLNSGYDFRFLKIYNRTGQLVFKTTSTTIGWDGTLDGKEMPLDTYYWLAEAKDETGKTKLFKGDVILVR